ncbi:MAG: PHP domain-containing protein [Eubacteriales bacterium]
MKIMNKYYYDLHLHSCLSPCGDADMTPNNIAGMAALKGLQIAALTDHNTCKNCPAFLAACKKNGLIGIAGMELTTAEEIHLVCLFEELENALAFSDAVDQKRYKIRNKPEIFGEQLILDADDNVIGEEEHLLINATSLDLESAAALARQFGAFVCPAHIDKQANGIIGVLYGFPEYPSFRFAELADLNKAPELKEAHPLLKKCSLLCSSDAHYLWDIHEAEYSFAFDDEPYSSASIRAQLFRKLLSGDKEATA